MLEETTTSTPLKHNRIFIVGTKKDQTVHLIIIFNIYNQQNQ